ncbi:SdpI family protein [Nonomuraea sp. LPB2021202275-12-8]|uniref:SdpI family protein n=1 Tax=Nonomuraea sp. LPB2021202275-12-8 TaxID=3120159 RepID=UPI00300CC6C5
MGSILMTAILTLPALALLIIPLYDESGAVDSRNGLAGLRTRQTLASREAWDAAHAWAKAPMRRLALLMVMVVAVSVVAELVLGPPDAAEAAVVTGQALLLVGGLLVICRQANRVAAETNSRIAADRPS